jgi:hypothetical protein
MPFIPLWQLDRHVVFADAVQVLDGVRPLRLDDPVPTIDPLRVFGTVESWEVVKK